MSVTGRCTPVTSDDDESSSDDDYSMRTPSPSPATPTHFAYSNDFISDPFDVIDAFYQYCSRNGQFPRADEQFDGDTIGSKDEALMRMRKEACPRDTISLSSPDDAQHAGNDWLWGVQSILIDATGFSLDVVSICMSFVWTNKMMGFKSLSWECAQYVSDTFLISKWFILLYSACCLL